MNRIVSLLESERDAHDSRKNEEDACMLSDFWKGKNIFAHLSVKNKNGCPLCSKQAIVACKTGWNHTNDQIERYLKC